MFFAVRAGAPRMVVLTGCSIATLGRSAGLGGSAGTPPRVPGALGLTSLVCDGSLNRWRTTWCWLVLRLSRRVRLALEAGAAARPSGAVRFGASRHCGIVGAWFGHLLGLRLRRFQRRRHCPRLWSVRHVP